MNVAFSLPAGGEALATALSARGIGHRFGERTVLGAVDLELGGREVVALLGPSGCGKTTFLRIIAGLLVPDRGLLDIAGRIVAADGRAALPPEQRGLGMVFQDYALWPHLSVLDNVGFPLRMRGLSGDALRRRALTALDRVGLADLAARPPGTLSGGQQQRVALARAIVAEPPLLLFDEPLSNLDRELRESLSLEISALLRDLGVAAVYVTHDQGEAFTVADRVAVMLGGQIAQIDDPITVCHAPRSAEVAGFLQLGGLFAGVRRAGRFVSDHGGIVADLAGPDGPGTLLVPRRAVQPVSLDQTGTIRLPARVARCQFLGDRFALHLRVAGEAQMLTCASDDPVAPGTNLSVELVASRLRFFPA